MKPYLSRFRLSGEWAPLLHRLPGWRQERRNTWTDGLSRVTIAIRAMEPSFGFAVHGVQSRAEILARIGVVTPDHQKYVRIVTPSGVRVSIHFEDEAPVQGLAGRVLFMNHVAVNVVQLQADWSWFERLLGPSTVLARDSAWEPVSCRNVRDVHLFQTPFFYLTLRESHKHSFRDHVGWMAKNQLIVDEMACIVSALNWKIVFGPTEIDGSYLFHFLGPDGGVHDFFFPTEALSPIQEP